MNLEELYHKFKSCGSISIDSRTLPKGCLYIAIKGNNFNGNAFAQEALHNGAAYAVVQEVEFATDENIFLVPDTLQFLQQLAHRYRNSFIIPFIGITGSNGKTTTKELLYSVLKQKYKTHVTKGNLNNHIGLPLTILSMPTDTEIAVIEMGANKVGDNAELCEIFDPNFGLITNIGKEHLEGFGNIEGVVLGNGELFNHLQKKGGTTFVNLQQEQVLMMASKLSNKITYGLDIAEANYSAEVLSINPSIKLAIEGTIINSPLFGTYNAENMMAAIAIGLYFETPLELIKKGIEEYVPANNRSQVIERNSNHIIVDCYNANPSSMEVSIKNFMGMNLPGKSKVLMLGDMYETGAFENEEHAAIAKLVLSLKPDKTYLCGKAFGVQKNLLNCEWFEKSENLAEHLKKHPIENASIFIKGSRGMQMEKLLENL
ncbi:MAG: UDP-N-acetylmuramoyl-tripeptide--D-alanyl-D-alanine ligase [Bacteroidota bacterium]|nr:UDP-N-acetylmuramoyl-tripeptide--D-alanyl-D-alanine ligase [Bacteroidota bacterium]